MPGSEAGIVGDNGEAALLKARLAPRFGAALSVAPELELSAPEFVDGRKKFSNRYG